jgi:hypothetical protein
MLWQFSSVRGQRAADQLCGERALVHHGRRGDQLPVPPFVRRRRDDLHAQLAPVSVLPVVAAVFREALLFRSSFFVL